jgi:hypothetical protein
MLDKTGQTGSPLQLVNGLILISLFACARLGYGFIIVRIFFDLCVQWFLGYLSRHGFSPVIPISSNITRGARRALEFYFRELHLWKSRPLRVERVLVRSISFVSFRSLFLSLFLR